MEKLITFRQYSESELLNVSTSTLAWIGDAVFTLAIREYFLDKQNTKPVSLHRLATTKVNAEAQSEALKKIEHMLTEQEQSVVRRAKNSPISTKSKHYGLAEYKRATGFEALIGYLYLLDNRSRLNEILAIVLED